MERVLDHELAAPLEIARARQIASRDTARGGRRAGRLLAAADLTGSVAAGLAAWAATGTANAAVLGAAIGVGVLVLAGAWGLYARDEAWLNFSTADDVPRLAAVVTALAWASWLALATTFAVPRVGWAIVWAGAIVLALAGRLGVRAWLRTRPRFVQDAIVVGADPVGARLARKFRQHPEYGVRVIGVVAGRAGRTVRAGEPVLGHFDDLEEIVRVRGVRRVVFTDAATCANDVVPVVRSLRRRGVHVDFVPRAFEIMDPGARVQSVEGVPVVGVAASPLSPGALAVKRAVDVVGATALLVLALPALAVAAVAIKLSSPGPVLFRQERLGHSRRPFVLLKLRTMTAETDASMHRDYVERALRGEGEGGIAGGDALRGEGEGGIVGGDALFKVDQRDRVTPVGRRLRRFSLDELPQLVNVLRGEMSLVGPRPCLAYEAALFDEHQSERFLVAPGLTGWWQVSARAHASAREALEMDVAYVRSWSLALYLWLILRTPLAVIRQRTATL
jgi:exopolysaccharide biosynthesis polyprenyl glycosylphosphotransferase